MTLCRLMVLDFTKGTGSEDENGPFYDARDAEAGAVYAEGLLEEGHTREPFYDFDLFDFAEWCRERATALAKS